MNENELREIEYHFKPDQVGAPSQGNPEGLRVAQFQISVAILKELQKLNAAMAPKPEEPKPEPAPKKKAVTTKWGKKK